MPAHRAPRWSPAEVDILRSVYPSGGLKAALEVLPNRSWHSIQVKAHKLGIRCEKLPDAPRCTVAGDRLEEAIRLRNEGWSFGKIGAHFGVAESSVSNAVLNELCVRQGYTPAERHPNGRLAERGLERLRWMLKKGMKGVEIQLRLGVSASCVAEQRRRYNRELKAHGKALLPPPGGGDRYSGVKLTIVERKEAERLFLDGYGTAKVAVMAGISKTSCTRIRNRLVRRLRKSGQTLPGCDLNGKRHAMRDHARHVPEELKIRLRALIFDRVPVKRAAEICGIGACTAYRIRDELQAELGELPKPRLPGRLKQLAREMLRAQAIPKEHLFRFRELVREHGEPEARRLLRAEIVEAKRNMTFEDKLKLVASGRAGISTVQRIVAAGPERTLGGVATGALL